MLFTSIAILFVIESDTHSVGIRLFYLSIPCPVHGCTVEPKALVVYQHLLIWDGVWSRVMTLIEMMLVIISILILILIEAVFVRTAHQISICLVMGLILLICDAVRLVQAVLLSRDVVPHRCVFILAEQFGEGSMLGGKWYLRIEELVLCIFGNRNP